MTTPPEITEKEGAAELVDRAMQALGIQMEMKTDLRTAQITLKEMRLHDLETSYAPMQQFFKELISQPCSLQPMLQNIKQGLIEKHPAVLEFAAKALEEGWFAESEAIQKSVHVAFILEAMTASMCNSDVFFAEVLDHIREKERDIGLDNDHLLRTLWRHWPRTGSFASHAFAAAKAVSLDPAMIYFKLRRELGSTAITKAHVQKLRKRGKLSYLEYKLLLSACNQGTCHCSDWLRINIYEAGITEYNNDFKSNAISAYALSEDIEKQCHREVFKAGAFLPDGVSTHEFYASLVQADNYFPTFSYHQEWVSLYETWNMAFILGELDNLHFLFPKLFIPSVLNAKAENFLAARVTSLWLSINNALFVNFGDSQSLEGPANQKEMAQAWGEINKKYAFKLSQEHMQEDSSILEKNFEQTFAQPFYNLGRLIFKFLF